MCTSGGWDVCAVDCRCVLIGESKVYEGASCVKESVNYLYIVLTNICFR